jgi:hypothetical protein
MQKVTQPVAGKFRDHHRVPEHGKESDEGDVQAFVNHRLFLPCSAFRQGFSSGKRQSASATVTKLRSTETMLKRQGTPSWRNRPMSYNVAEEPNLRD